MSPPPPGSPTGPRTPSPKSGRPAGKTIGRAELSRRKGFAEISPEVGVLDEKALQSAMAEDASATLALIADMTSATDEALRAAVRRIAATLVLDRARVGRPRQSGIGRRRQVRATDGGDLDLDNSLEAIVGARGEGRAPSLEELVASDWGRTDLALAVILDHSGSMNGERLAAAAVTVAACALRSPGEIAVLAFAKDVTVLKPLASERSPGSVVNSVLALRGHGITALGKALAAAHDQLATAKAARRVVILLSDCRATDDQDCLPAARQIPELIILAPEQDSDQAQLLARQSGARFAPMADLDAVPRLLLNLLD